MENIMFLLIAMSILCTLFGVIYPLFCMFVLYPIYRMDGGKMSLKEYMKYM